MNTRHQRPGCTLTEMLFILLCLVCGCLVSQWTVRHLESFRWLGAIGGFVAGVVGAVLMFGALPAFASDLWRPSFPRCATGRCNQWRYRLDRVSRSRHAPADRDSLTIWKCRCGEEYVRVADRLMHVGPDGIWRPFQRRVWRRWITDAGDSLQGHDEPLDGPAPSACPPPPGANEDTQIA